MLVFPLPNSELEAEAVEIHTLHTARAEATSSIQANPAAFSPSPLRATERAFPFMSTQYPDHPVNFEGVPAFVSLLQCTSDGPVEVEEVREAILMLVSDIVYSSVPKGNVDAVLASVLRDLGSLLATCPRRAIPVLPSETQPYLSGMSLASQRRLGDMFLAAAKTAREASQMKESWDESAGKGGGVAPRSTALNQTAEPPITEEVKSAFITPAKQGIFTSYTHFAKTVARVSKNLGISPPMVRRLLSMEPFGLGRLLVMHTAEDDINQLARDIVAPEWLRERSRVLRNAFDFLRSPVDVAAHGSTEAAMEWAASNLSFLGIDPDSWQGQLICLSKLGVDDNIEAALASATLSGASRAPEIPTKPVEEWDASVVLGLPNTLAETVRRVIDTQAQKYHPNLVSHGPSINMWPCLKPYDYEGGRGTEAPSILSASAAGSGGERETPAPTATAALETATPQPQVSRPFRQGVSKSREAQPIADPSSQVGSHGQGALSRPPAAAPDLCPRCKSGFHWGRNCPSFHGGGRRNDQGERGRK